MTPTIDHARKILELAPLGLVYGKGIPEPGKMCIEALVCYVMGQKHGDEPQCVSSVDRRWKIATNDWAGWPDDVTRGKALARVGVCQLGTAGMDRAPWLREFASQRIRRVLPMLLRLHAWRYPDQWSEVEPLIARCVEDGKDVAAREVARFFNAAYAYAYADAADADAAADAYAYAYADAYADAYAYAYAYACDIRLAVMLECIACAETAYEITGTPGVDLLRQIEVSA